MKEAGHQITESLTKGVQYVSHKANIKEFEKFNVGVEVTFVEPIEWRKSQIDEKSASASVIGGFIAILLLIAIVSLFYEQFFVRSKPKSKTDYNMDQKEFEQLFQRQEDDRARESTKPTSLKFRISEGVDSNNSELITDENRKLNVAHHNINYSTSFQYEESLFRDNQFSNMGILAKIG